MNIPVFSSSLVHYNPEDSLGVFRGHFKAVHSGGGSLDYFSPARRSTGGGIGSTLVSIFKNTVQPIMKNLGKRALKNTVKSGLGLASDLMKGRSVKGSLKSRGLELAKNTVFGEGGGGPVKRTPIKRGKRKKTGTSKKVVKRRRRQGARDIFN